MNRVPSRKVRRVVGGCVGSHLPYLHLCLPVCCAVVSHVICLPLVHRNNPTSLAHRQCHVLGPLRCRPSIPPCCLSPGQCSSAIIAKNNCSCEIMPNHPPHIDAFARESVLSSAWDFAWSFHAPRSLAGEENKCRSLSLPVAPLPVGLKFVRG
jgi:hypothetical protein